MDSRKIIHDCVLYINTHLKEQLSLEGLAEQAGFSPYYFSRLFTLYMEIPVMEYVRRRRLVTCVKIEDPKELGIPFVEEDIMIYDVVNTEEAWVTTTPYCIAPVSKFNGQQLGDGTTPVFHKLLEAWGKRVGKDLWKELTEAQPIQFR